LLSLKAMALEERATSRLKESSMIETSKFNSKVYLRVILNLDNEEIKQSR